MAITSILLSNMNLKLLKLKDSSSWYFALKGHVEKYGGSLYKVKGGYEITYPDESAKDDFIAYASNLGKSLKENCFYVFLVNFRFYNNSVTFIIFATLSM